MWPHQFTKVDKGEQIGEDDTGTPILAIPMACVHCSAKFIQGREQRPADPCPARNDKREMKRIQNVTR